MNSRASAYILSNASRATTIRCNLRAILINNISLSLFNKCDTSIAHFHPICAFSHCAKTPNCAFLRSSKGVSGGSKPKFYITQARQISRQRGARGNLKGVGGIPVPPCSKKCLVLIPCSGVQLSCSQDYKLVALWGLQLSCTPGLVTLLIMARLFCRSGFCVFRCIGFQSNPYLSSLEWQFGRHKQSNRSFLQSQ